MDDLNLLALVLVLFASIAWAVIASQDLVGLKIDKKYVNVLLCIPLVVVMVIAFEALSVGGGLYVNTLNANVVNATTYLNLPNSTYAFLTANIVSNTIYQNTNSSMLSIYATARNSILLGYISPNDTSLTEVVTAGATGYNMTAIVNVPNKWYYKFNYTDASFAVIKMEGG